MTNHWILEDGEPVERALELIEAPTLLLHGNEDPPFPIGHAEALAAEIPGAPSADPHRCRPPTAAEGDVGRGRAGNPVAHVRRPIGPARFVTSQRAARLLVLRATAVASAAHHHGSAARQLHQPGDAASWSRSKPWFGCPSTTDARSRRAPCGITACCVSGIVQLVETSTCPSCGYGSVSRWTSTARHRARPRSR
jgi:hypothetical protein